MTDYRSAGVDLDGADRHVDRIGSIVTSTWHEDVVGGFGGFASGVTLPPGLHDPVMMLATDGVGTKLELARMSGDWSGVGHDLVAMCADDLVVAGARPLAFVDYLAVGTLDADRDAAIVESVAEACRLAGCALVGGETAEHPGTMPIDAVDLAGTALGVVERGDRLGPDRVEQGDVVLGLHSPNLRSNGFSLVRHVYGDVDLGDPFPEVGETIEQVLLSPSVIYAPAVLDAVGVGGVHAAAHVTGGGLEANLARSVPAGLRAVVDQWAWEWPHVFVDLQRRGGIATQEMRRTFNLGIGFCLVVAPGSVDSVSNACATHQPLVIGRIEGP